MSLERNVSRLLQEVLELTATAADGIAAAMPELDRMRLDAALRQLRRSTTASDVFFFAESLVAAKQSKKCARVIRLLLEHGSLADKVAIASSWVFTAPFRFGSGSGGERRHVMYEECAADRDWIRDSVGDPTLASYSTMGCTATQDSTALCPCRDWLIANTSAVDRAAGAVVAKLCEMRHSLVHESWPVQMVVEMQIDGRPSSHVVDAYPSDPADPGIFTSFETSMHFSAFKRLWLGVSRAYLEATHS